jgi:hypothetical protein
MVYTISGLRYGKRYIYLRNLSGEVALSDYNIIGTVLRQRGFAPYDFVGSTQLLRTFHIYRCSRANLAGVTFFSTNCGGTTTLTSAIGFDSAGHQR